jgi:hypothetical protein
MLLLCRLAHDTDLFGGSVPAALEQINGISTPHLARSAQDTDPDLLKTGEALKEALGQEASPAVRQVVRPLYTAHKVPCATFTS